MGAKKCVCVCVVFSQTALCITVLTMEVNGTMCLTVIFVTHTVVYIEGECGSAQTVDARWSDE